MNLKKLEMISLYENIKSDNTLYLSNYHFSTKNKILNDMKSIEKKFYANDDKLYSTLKYNKVNFREGNFILINTEKLEKTQNLINTEKLEKTQNEINMIGCYIPFAMIILGCSIVLWNALKYYSQ